MDVEEEGPEGFARHFRRSPATDPWEPLWSRQDEAGLTLAVWIGDRHCNARGLLHGGVLSSLADNAMGLACSAMIPGLEGLLTVHLSIDYLGAARPGDWLEVRARPDRVGGSIAFGAADAFADGEQVARASAVFKVVRART